MNTIHVCLRYVRSEEMKEIRRRIGDNGGIKFQGKVPSAREDGCINTLTNVLKDNPIMTTTSDNEYSEIELTPDSVVEPLGDCRFRIDGRVLRFAIRKLTPRECLRLMDVDEKDIDKFFAAGLSNSQIYRQAGNSIVVSNLYHIFRKMFIDTQQEYKYGDQMQLF